MFEIVRQTFSTLNALRRAKLGRCPRCQRIAGWGSLGSWGLCLLTRAATLPPGWTIAMATIASVFTILLAAHAVAFALWMAEALRKAQPSGTQFENWTPREFGWLIARLTVINLRTSLFGGR